MSMATRALRAPGRHGRPRPHRRPDNTIDGFCRALSHRLVEAPLRVATARHGRRLRSSAYARWCASVDFGRDDFDDISRAPCPLVRRTTSEAQARRSRDGPVSAHRHEHSSSAQSRSTSPAPSTQGEYNGLMNLLLRGSVIRGCGRRPLAVAQLRPSGQRTLSRRRNRTPYILGRRGQAETTKKANPRHGQGRRRGR